MALVLIQKGRDCVDIARSTVNDLNHGNTEEAQAKLEILRQNGTKLANHAEDLSQRFEKVQEYNKRNEEEKQREISRCGCEEQNLRQQKNNVEAKLVGQRSTLEAKRSELTRAQEDLRNAERNLREKKEEAKKIRASAAAAGIVIGVVTLGIGGAAAGAVGTAAIAAIGLLVAELTKVEQVARMEVGHRKSDCSKAQSDIDESNSRISQLSSGISSLVQQARQLELKRLQYHEKVGKMKEAIAFTGKTIHLWSLCKQVANHGVNRAGLLYRIIDKATSKANLGVLSKSSTQKTVGTFLEAWEEMETLAEESENVSLLKIDFKCAKCRLNFHDLPHVEENHDAICDSCYHRNSLNNGL